MWIQNTRTERTLLFTKDGHTKEGIQSRLPEDTNFHAKTMLPGIKHKSWIRKGLKKNIL